MSRLLLFTLIVMSPFTFADPSAEVVTSIVLPEALDVTHLELLSGGDLQIYNVTNDHELFTGAYSEVPTQPNQDAYGVSGGQHGWVPLVVPTHLPIEKILYLSSERFRGAVAIDSEANVFALMTHVRTERPRSHTFYLHELGKKLRPWDFTQVENKVGVVLPVEYHAIAAVGCGERLISKGLVAANLIEPLAN